MSARPKGFSFIASMPRLNRPASQWREQLLRIESLGFDMVAISDHFTGGWMMEPLVTMASAAAITERLRVLSLVMCNDYRHPVQVHKAIATMDVLSSGRVSLGLGAGWLRGEYDAAGIPFDPAAVRIDRLTEAITVIKGLFADPPVHFKGQHYQIDAIDGLPKPVQRPHPPLLVGGGSRRVLELAGRTADIVGINPALPPGRKTGLAITDMTPDRVAEKVRWARAAASDAGRDPDELEFLVSVHSLTVTDGAAATWISSMASAVAHPGWLDSDELRDSPAVLHGTVDECVETLLRRRERFGFNHIDFGLNVNAAAPIVARLAGQ